MRSEWFNYTELSLTTAVQGKRGEQGAVRGGSRASNLLEPSRTTSSQELASCVKFFYMSLGLFDYTELSLTTSLQVCRVQTDE